MTKCASQESQTLRIWVSRCDNVHAEGGCGVWGAPVLRIITFASHSRKLGILGWRVVRHGSVHQNAHKRGVWGVGYRFMCTLIRIITWNWADRSAKSSPVHMLYGLLPGFEEFLPENRFRTTPPPLAIVRAPQPGNHVSAPGAANPVLGLGRC